MRLPGGSGLLLVTQFSQVMHVILVTSRSGKYKGEFRGDEVGRWATLLHALPRLDRDRLEAASLLDVETGAIYWAFKNELRL